MLKFSNKYCLYCVTKELKGFWLPNQILIMALILRMPKQISYKDGVKIVVSLGKALNEIASALEWMDW